jgi:hypothetical protein
MCVSCFYNPRQRCPLLLVSVHILQNVRYRDRHDLCMEYILAKLFRGTLCPALAMNQHGYPSSLNQPTSGLLQLPPELLLLIDQHAQEDDERPLLPVCRTARDSVLQTSKEVTLVLPRAGDRFSLTATAQLLDRACSLAPEGLRINIHGGCEHSMALAALSQSGAEKGGWRNVRTLSLEVRGSAPAHVLH